AQRRLDHLAQRFVAEHEPLLAGRRFAVGAGEDLAVGPAHAERPGPHQDRALLRRRIGHVVEPCRIGGAGGDGAGAPPCPLVAPSAPRLPPAAEPNGPAVRSLAAASQTQRSRRRSGTRFAAQAPYDDISTPKPQKSSRRRETKSALRR